MRDFRQGQLTLNIKRDIGAVEFRVLRWQSYLRSSIYKLEMAAQALHR